MEANESPVQSDSQTDAVANANVGEAAATPAPDAISAIAPRGSWLDWLVNALRHEPTHALTLLYLLVSALGVWASYWFFRQFHIPILDYMDPSDYLTAGLRDPAYVGIVIGSLVFTFLLNFSNYARARGETYYESVRAHWLGHMLTMGHPYVLERKNFLERLTGWRGFSVSTGLVFGVVWATMWLTLSYVNSKAADIKEGGGHPVRITFAHEHEPHPDDARLLGTVGDFAFVYWPRTRQSEAISIENIKRMESLAGDQLRSATAAPTPPAAGPAAH